ncbi:hypothetical protein OHU34_38500 [Streptomyces sp. NBC_00080]|uniref:hypothetical protein n=1 Tax=Streptomyces sp. NBC_00080 TaxID=2975645 RepID=UPI00324F2B21
MIHGLPSVTEAVPSRLRTKTSPATRATPRAPNGTTPVHSRRCTHTGCWCCPTPCPAFARPGAHAYARTHRGRLRLRRQLIDNLLEGTDETSACARAEAVDHDLQRTHYVVAVHWPGDAATSSFTCAVEQATATTATRPLITRRGDRMVLPTEARMGTAPLRAGPVGAVAVRCGPVTTFSHFSYERDEARPRARMRLTCRGEGFGSRARSAGPLRWVRPRSVFPPPAR